MNSTGGNDDHGDVQRFDELLERFLAGALDDAGLAELRAAVHGDVERQRRLAEAAVQVATLREALREPGAAGSDQPRPVVRPRAPRATGTRPWGMLVTAAAALLLVGAAWWWWAQPVAPAILSNCLGTVTIERQGVVRPADDGDALHAGDRIVCQASVSADVYWRGEETRFALSAPRDGSASLVIERSGPDGKRLTLERGSLLAEVAPQPSRLEIRTPHAAAEVVGTRFTLSVGLQTDLSVEHGMVRLRALDGGTAVDVGSGQRATASASMPPTVAAVPAVPPSPATATPTEPGADRPWRDLPLAEWKQERGTWTSTGGVLTGVCQRDGEDLRCQIATVREVGDVEFACRIRSPDGMPYAEVQVHGYSLIWIMRKPALDAEWSQLRVRVRGAEVSATLDGEPLVLERHADAPRGSIIVFGRGPGTLEVSEARFRE